MDTPMPCDNDCLNKFLDKIKPAVRKLSEYHAPPQDRVSVKLNQNESPFDIPESLKDKILEDMKNQNWGHYPDYVPQTLREKLAKRFGIDPLQILIGNGSNSLILAVFTALIQPSDTIVLSPPSFSLYELIGSMVEGNIISVPQNMDFTYNQDALIQAVSKAKLSVFSSPGNPTGQILPLESLKAMLKATPGLILWDEAYAEFSSQTAIPLLASYPNLLILRTFSKAFSMAGLRLGCLLAHSKLVAQIQKVTMPYNVNLFTMTAALHVLEETDWPDANIQKILIERANLLKAMGELRRVEPFLTETNFITFRVQDGKDVFQRLKEKGVLVRDMSGYPELKNCLRVTVGTPEENQTFLTELKKIVKP